MCRKGCNILKCKQLLMETGTTADIKKTAEAHELAFVIGNGLNLHIQSSHCIPNNSKVPSWDKLLRKCTKGFHELNGLDTKFINSYPEMFSLAMLNTEENIHDNVSEEFQKLSPSRYHKKVTEKLISYDAPVLTTNYDKLIDDGLNSFGRVASTIESNLTEYKSVQILELPESGFGIWHINGDCNKADSMRLGIGNYAYYLVQIYKHVVKAFNIDEKDDVFGKSWLKPFFMNKLCFIGLGLREEEFVLRWLLYKRRIYWKKLHHINHWKKTGWYLYSKKDFISKPTLLFLENTGITPVYFDKRETIYKELFDI